MNQYYLRLDLNGFIVYADVNFQILTGLDSKSLAIHKFENFVAPHSIKHFREILSHLLLSCNINKVKRDAAYREEKLILLINDKEQVVEFSFSPEGEFLHCIGQSRAVEVALAQKISQLERTLRLSPAALYQFQLQPNGTKGFTYLSERAFDIYEFSQETYLMDTDIVFNVVHDDDKASLETNIVESAKNLNHFKWEGRIITASGTKWVSAESIPEKLFDGTIIWEGIIIETTQSKLLEQEHKRDQLQLIHANRMSELGKMAGGIAHEINNPIHAIQLNAERLASLAASSQLKPETVTETSHLIMRISERISKIVKSLRQLSRDAGSDPFEMASTNLIIHDTLDLCTSRIQKSSINLEVPEAHEEIFIECRPTELAQVLLVLINNSADAISQDQNPWIRIEVEDQNTDFVLKVIDSGKGLPKNISDKIMTPFFTTKAKGQGTGLGLSIAKNIIEKHGGRIYVDKTHPHTCFCIQLPKYQNTTLSA